LPPENDWDKDFLPTLGGSWLLLPPWGKVGKGVIINKRKVELGVKKFRLDYIYPLSSFPQGGNESSIDNSCFLLDNWED